MSKWLKFKYYLFVGFWYAVIFAGIYISAWFNGKVVEATLLLIAYFVLRYTFPKTYHCKQYWQCIFFSITAFCVVIPMVLPISVSIFSSIFMGGIIGLVLCRVQEFAELKERELNQPTIFELTKDELCQLLESTIMSDEEKRAVELRVIEHYKGNQWYTAMGYCKRQCQYLYKHGLEKLNKQLRLH